MDWIGAMAHTPRMPLILTIVAIVFSVYGGVRVIQIRRNIRNLKLGLDGERAVGQFLDGLREDGARIFHDVPANAFNIDHVVISTRGLFVVETKTLSKPSSDAAIVVTEGRITAGGRALDRDPIQQVKAAAEWLRSELAQSTGKKLPVRPVVVFPGWFVEPMDSASRKTGAWVLEPKALPAFIGHEAEVMPMSDVALAAFHLSRYIRTVESKPGWLGTSRLGRRRGSFLRA